MAMAATIFKTELDLSDTDRNHYQHYALTLARHPSETNERMMVRLLAFIRHADEQLSFAKGLSETSEPDLWQKDLTGSIVLWIETGLPDARRLTQACGRAAHVVVYAYGKTAAQWWKQVEASLDRLQNLSVYILPVDFTQALAALAERSMRIQSSIYDGQIYLTAGEKTLHLDWQSALYRGATI